MKKLTIRLPDEIYNRIMNDAKLNHDGSFNAQVNEVLSAHYIPTTDNDIESADSFLRDIANVWGDAWASDFWRRIQHRYPDLVWDKYNRRLITR